MMDLLVRGQYVIVSAEEEEKDQIPDQDFSRFFRCWRT